MANETVTVTQNTNSVTVNQSANTVAAASSNPAASFGGGGSISGSLNISQHLDVDGILETDALTINGVPLLETIQDAVGGMVTGNTETGITVNYEDSDGTLDFAVAAQTDHNFTTEFKGKLENITPLANNYSHPTGAGNNHIPTGGAANQFLKYSASGTAVWETPSYTTNTNTTYSVGDGGLTEKNFTTALEEKLEDIADNANNYSHPTGAGNNHIPTGGAANQFLEYSSSGTAVWGTPTDTNTTYGIGDGGLTEKNFTTALEEKLEDIADNANNYSHPTGAGNNHIPTGGAANQFLKYSASGTAVWETPSYTTNTNTTYSVGDGGLTEKNFTTALEEKLEDIADNANNYSHPTGAGNNHIPTGGAANQFLEYSASGTAVWGTPTDTNTTYSVGDGGLTQNNFTDADHLRLNNIADNANNYSHPTGAGNNHIPTGGAANQFLKYSASGTAVWGTPTDTNTTYSVGDGGLTEKNFTTALEEKLEDIADDADVTPSWVPSSDPSYATQNYVGTQVANLVASAPDDLNTLNELAVALGGDDEFAATVNTNIGNKLPKSGGEMTGDITMSSSEAAPLKVDGRDLSVDGAKLDDIADNANNYSHPTGAGNNHIPTGGAANQFLKYSASGTAIWETPTDTNTTYSVGDGGLTEKNFTTALEEKLEDIADNANNYSHPTGAGNNHIPTGGAANQFLKYSASGTAIWETPTDTNTTYSVGDGGLTEKNFTTALEEKLEDIADNANNYSHPTGAGNNHIPTGGAANQFLKYSASGTAVWETPSYTTNTDTTYSVGDGGLTEKNFTTALEEKLEDIADNANNYSHPTGAGNNHIPTGGAANQFLKYSSSGTAVWETPSYTTNTDTTYSVGDGGLTEKNFTTTLKEKLEDITDNANNYSHPTGAGNNHIPTGGVANQFLKYSASGTAVWGTPTDTDTTYSVGDGGLTEKNFHDCA